MIRLCVLDMAGTTVADDGAVERAFLTAMERSGLEISGPDADRRLEYVRRTMGMSKITVFRALLGDEERAQAANAAFERAYADEVSAGRVVPIEGAEGALRALRDAGIRVALTTGFADATRRLIVETLGWAPLVDLSLSPGDGLRGRPAPDMVLAALMRLEIDDVREVAVCGDTANDLLSGTRAGASVVAGVLTGAHGRSALTAGPHTHVLDSVRDLPELLDA